MSFIALAAFVFGVGLYGVLSRRDVIGILASVEVMLGAATLMLVGLGASVTSALGEGWSTGTLGATGLVIVMVAAAEAAVGLALLVAVARSLGTSRIDEMTRVRG